MPATYAEAVDQIFGLFMLEWNGNAQPIVGYNPEIRWQGVEEKPIPSLSKFWCRVSIQTIDEEQTTLKNSSGKKRYTATGLIFVQIFCPRDTADSWEKGKKLAMVAKNAFRGKTTSGKVWLRNVRIQELPPEDKAYRLNVVAEFEYDEEN